MSIPTKTARKARPSLTTETPGHVIVASGRSISEVKKVILPELPPIPNHPLSSVVGSMADEPLWDDWVEEIRKYRQMMDSLEEVGS